jgi:hypothetical protein
MLKKALEFTHSDPKAVFWTSWVLSALILLPRILEKFRWHPAGGFTDPWQFGVLILLILLAIVAGWPFWKILQKEKHASIRESIVVVVGFVPIQVLFLFPLNVIYEVIISISHLEAEKPLFMIGFAISSLVGGCWIGFKKTGKTWLWCALGALFFWGSFIIERITWGTKGISWGTSKNSEVLIWIALAIVGGYFGRRVSLRENEQEADASVA